MHVARVVLAGERLPRPNKCPDQVHAIMQNCWKSAPRDRPAMVEIQTTMHEAFAQEILESSKPECVVCLNAGEVLESFLFYQPQMAESWSSDYQSQFSPLSVQCVRVYARCQTWCVFCFLTFLFFSQNLSWRSCRARIGALASNVDQCSRCALSAELQYTKPSAFLVRLNFEVFTFEDTPEVPGAPAFKPKLESRLGQGFKP